MRTGTNLTGPPRYQRHREKRERQQYVLCVHLDYVLTLRPKPPAFGIAASALGNDFLVFCLSGAPLLCLEVRGEGSDDPNRRTTSLRGCAMAATSDVGWRRGELLA